MKFLEYLEDHIALALALFTLAAVGYCYAVTCTIEHLHGDHIADVSEMEVAK